MGVNHCNNIADLRRLARRRLPAAVFHYLDGGADDELTLRRNTDAFDDYELLPSQLSDVSSIDTKSTLFGMPIHWPVMISPTGASKLFHGEGEAAVIRAAQKFGMFLCVQDLTCPGYSFLHSASLAARVPTVAAIEGNGRQFCPAANRKWGHDFPSMFNITDGTVGTGALDGIGLGF